MSCSFGGEEMYNRVNQFNRPEQYDYKQQSSYVMVNDGHYEKRLHEGYSGGSCTCFCHGGSYSKRKDYTTLCTWTSTHAGNVEGTDNGMWSTGSLGTSSTSEELSTRTRLSPSSPDRRPLHPPTTINHVGSKDKDKCTHAERTNKESDDGEGTASGPWTKAESEELLRHYTNHVNRYPEGPIKWSTLGRLLSRRRTGTQCQARYSESLDPFVLRGRWTPTLDKLLVQLAERYENKWTRVSASIPGKTQRQCRSRWVALNRRN